MRLLIAGACLALLPAAGQTFTPDSFAAEVEALQTSLDTQAPADIARTLPAVWEVQTPGKHYSVSTERLRAILAPMEAEAPPSEARIAQAREYLTGLEQEVYGSALERSGGGAEERRTLEEILERSEFEGVRPPSAWDQFWLRALAWIRSVIDRILQFAAAHPTGSQVLFWTLLSGGVAFLALWLYRVWSRGQAAALPRAPAEEEAAARSWQEWMLAARDAAQRGDSREAIRCAYWAGVARLQEDRMLPARLSKTPRECLRMIAGAPREPLRGLTTALERFWYAGHGAGPGDVDESFRHLETLGCKVD